MKAYTGVEIQVQSFLTTALGGSDLVHDIHWRASWVGSTARMDTLEKGKPNRPCWVSFPLRVNFYNAFMPGVSRQCCYVDKKTAA